MTVDLKVGRRAVSRVYIRKELEDIVQIDWQGILSGFGGGALASTLISSLYKHWSERNIEKYRSELEASLEPRTHLGKIQFEKEFGIYTSIWPILNLARRAALALRPAMSPLMSVEAQEEEKKRKLAEMHKALEQFQDAFEESRPFYPESVYQSLCLVRDVARREAIAYHSDNPLKEDYWDKAEKNRDELIQKIDDACQAVRLRLAEIVVIDNV